jgi:hypothetical protein
LGSAEKKFKFGKKNKMKPSSNKKKLSITMSSATVLGQYSTIGAIFYPPHGLCGKPDQSENVIMSSLYRYMSVTLTRDEAW